MRRPTRSPFHRPAMQTLERLHAELGYSKTKPKRCGWQIPCGTSKPSVKMLDPTYNLRRIAVKRRRPNPWFKRGTVYRRAVDAPRTATEPLTAREIAERVLATANLKRPDKAALADLIRTVLASLRNHKGKVSSVPRGNARALAACWLTPNLMGSADLQAYIEIGVGLLPPGTSKLRPQLPTRWGRFFPRFGKEDGRVA
jgi:hypothetical protein